MNTDMSDLRVVLLCGGVGAAKLARGLSRQVAPANLTMVVNVGDDFDHLGLRICPDLDSVMYGLADVHDRARGWGRRDETWRALGAITAVGGADWFALGDLDLGVHLVRTAALDAGDSLTTVTHKLARSFGVNQQILPVSDMASPTELSLVDGRRVSFQEYFVKLRHQVEVSAIHFDHAASAAPTTQVTAAIDNADLIVIAPSNPLLSIDPILAIGDLRQLIAERRNRTVAVSPIIGGRALKGPADQLMNQLGLTSDASGVAEIYQNYATAMVIDTIDQALVPKINALDMACQVGDTLMDTDDGEDRVARLCLNAIGSGR